LRYSIADALTESVNYLRAAVAFALACCEAETPPGESPLEARRLAQGAARRLDDAFREYLSERGSKSVSLADVSSLIAGVTAVRTTADSIQSLWTSDERGRPDDRRVVREALTQGVESLSRWYAELAEVMTGSRATLSAPFDFDVSVRELVNTVRRELSDESGHGTAAAFKIVWTDDYLRQLHRLQERILPVAEKIAESSARSTGRPSRRAPRRLFSLRSGSV
jgi:hypothetical protein